MLGKLFQKKDSAQAPAGKRIYAIGDVHGCLEELEALLEKARDDNCATDLSGSVFGNEESCDTPPKPALVFLGDYVDRGPESRGVLDRLIVLQQAEPGTIFLKGNHEALMLDFLANPEDIEHWLEWGGEETLQSYGVSPVLGRSSKELAEALRENLPETHLSFLQSLALTHIEGDYCFVHAGLRPGVAIGDQQEEDLLWIRKKFHKTSPGDRPDKIVVHGHQPVEKPLDAGWRICVDTGACWTGRLTAVVLEGSNRRFIST